VGSHLEIFFSLSPPSSLTPSFFLSPSIELARVVWKKNRPRGEQNRVAPASRVWYFCSAVSHIRCLTIRLTPLFLCQHPQISGAPIKVLHQQPKNRTRQAKEREARSSASRGAPPLDKGTSTQALPQHTGGEERGREEETGGILQ
jgi:hypothetical protein